MKDYSDFDRYIDYASEYRSCIQSPVVSGDELTGLCPFHQDGKRSFSANIKTGLWHCFAEDEGGDFFSFYAKFNQVSREEAKKTICQKYNVPSRNASGGKEKSGALSSYTLEQYSADKHLPLRFLSESFHLETVKEYAKKAQFLKIPYFNEEKEQTCYRKRYGGKEFRWARGSKNNIGLYGAWFLPDYRKKDYAVLVEGESDTQTLVYLGFPALGVPGASMFKPEHAAALAGISRIYIHQEPDKGGETFRRKVSQGLQVARYEGKVLVWSCSASAGQKDPSDVFTASKDKESAAEAIRQAMGAAKEINLEAELDMGGLTEAPISLKVPAGWTLTDKGISQFDKRSGEMVLVCRTPLLLTQRVKSLESGEEKIEIAYRRDGEWLKAIYPRSTIFDSKGIRILSDLGCMVTSENARGVVSFLGELEAENYEALPLSDAASVLGWQPGPGRRFVPGYGGNIVLDIDPSQRAMVAAYCTAGTLEAWVQTMAPHRARNRFRFILAASFAAPLLKIIRQRIFFVYNWGGSKGGKTAALKAALSAWGDPDRLMVNFNSTQVGLERTAALYCDLPLGIDERQLAGTNQGSLEKTVYMIAAGAGKLRGAKNGGIQQIQQWRTVALATGEEPLATDTSQTGVSTRTLEIYGGPFDNEADASLMHQKAGENYGHAGPAFIGALLQMTEDEIRMDYARMEDYIRTISEGKNGAHIAGIAAVALADMYIGQLFFGANDEDAEAEARAMAAEILTTQVEANTTDVNESAVQAVTDWVLSNLSSFNDHGPGPCFGYLGDDNNTAYIFPSVLNQAIEKAGYSPRKTLRYMADTGLIEMVTERSGRKQYTVTKRLGGRLSRFVAFRLGEVSQPEDGAGGLEGPDGPQNEALPLPEEQDVLNGWGWTEAPGGAQGNEPLPF